MYIVYQCTMYINVLVFNRLMTLVNPIIHLADAFTLIAIIAHCAPNIHWSVLYNAI